MQQKTKTYMYTYFDVNALLFPCVGSYMQLRVYLSVFVVLCAFFLPGIPRFNDMRRSMNMNPIKKWSDLTKDTESQVSIVVYV